MGLQASTSEEAYEGDLCGKEAYRAYLQKIDDEFRNEITALSWKQDIENLRREKDVVHEELEKVKHELEVAKAVTCKQVMELNSLNAEHSAMVAKLENEYDDRQIELTNKFAAKEIEHMAAVESWSKKMNEKDLQHQAQIDDLMSSSQSSTNNLHAEVERLKDQVNITEKMMHEMLKQQEDEFLRKFSQLSASYAIKVKDKQDIIDEANVAIQKLEAKREWLSRQAKELNAQVGDVQRERMEETQRCQQLTDEIDRMKCIQKLKDDDMAQLRVQMGAITLEKNQLEKSLLVIKAKCEDLKSDRASVELTINHQKGEVAELLKKLKLESNERDALRRVIEVHLLKIQAKDVEIKSLTAKVRNRDRRLRMLKDALVDLSGISNEKLLANQVKVITQTFVNEEGTK